MNDADRIDLAHAPRFALGRLSVRPGTRELIRDDGESEILEPRVMQVLVALARAEGAIVTRDELSRWCWEGRVVGEDAINRVLSRLRRSAEGIGEGSFRIETITKVGYRLLADRSTLPETVATPASATRRPRLSRRAMIGGGAALAVSAGAVVTFGLLRRRPARAGPPAEVAAMMARAETAYRELSPEGNNEAIGLLRRITEIAPDYADGWGLLSVAYGQAYWGRGNRTDPGLLTRAKEAIARARRIDPENGYAMRGEIGLLTLNGTWGTVQRLAHEGLEHDPDNDLLLAALANSYALVGCPSDAVPLDARAAELQPAVATYRYQRAIMLWSSGKLDEADRVIDDGLRLFPSQFALWFLRYYVDLYSGQVGKAIAHLEDKANRPVGYADAEFDRLLLGARAMETRDARDIDTAIAAMLEAACWRYRALRDPDPICLGNRAARHRFHGCRRAVLRARVRSGRSAIQRRAGATQPPWRPPHRLPVQSAHRRDARRSPLHQAD